VGKIRGNQGVIISEIDLIISLNSFHLMKTFKFLHKKTILNLDGFSKKSWGT